MRKDGCLSLSIAMLVFFLVMAVSYYGLAFMTLPLFRGSKGFIHKSLKLISARITILLGHLSDTTLSTPFIAGDLAAEWAIVLPTLFLLRTQKKKEKKKRNLGMKDPISPKWKSTREFTFLYPCIAAMIFRTSILGGTVEVLSTTC